MSKLHITHNREYSPWFNREIISILRLKELCFKTFKKHNSEEYHNLFKYYRAKSKSRIESSYKKYIANVQINVRDNPKTFCSIRNDKQEYQEQCCMVVMNFPESIVNGFGQYFNSVYSKSQPTAIQDYVADFFTNFSITIQTISREVILNGLKRLKKSFRYVGN